MQKSILSGVVQPERWMMWVAAQMPQRTATSRARPCTYWARKPPTKASPAPLVSTILSADNFSAANVRTYTGGSLVIDMNKGINNE